MNKKNLLIFQIGLINDFNKIDNDELKPYINDIIKYLNEFDRFEIEEIDEISIFLKKLNKRIKKIEIIESEKIIINSLINNVIEFNNDLLMTIIMSNI